MEHIGSGWQFDAYALGDQVLKVPVSASRMAFRVLRSYPGLIVRPGQLRQKVRGLMAERGRVLSELEAREIDRSLLANFRQKDGRFVQDLVKPLETVLAEGRLDPFWMIDRYVQSIRQGWRAGFAETSFNFTVNHGLNRRGNVVVIDVGELCFDRAAVAEMVEARFWEGAFSLRVLPDALADYFLRAMARTVTPQALRADWVDARLSSRRALASDRPATRKAHAPSDLLVPRKRPVLVTGGLTR